MASRARASAYDDDVESSDRWDGERLKLKKIAATREGRRRATRGCYGDDNESGDHEERASVTVSRASRRASSS